MPGIGLGSISYCTHMRNMNTNDVGNGFRIYNLTIRPGRGRGRVTRLSAEVLWFGSLCSRFTLFLKEVI